ncbi:MULTISPECIES: prepilin-type N-terminal cleavage/methylation domain-containing protein [unclassified Rhizobium]|uniref:GspH/FimT family pseudopilin n=1 Tax=unclassified Rhizobium TaxID=2613769 RepID=UPI0010458930|nr:MULTISPECIES: prepilin-type N-terminal cleavage/methylation domain-containing protein [unclassified Rhizobium]MBB3396520.1 general secretion pathway protein H [Rhizobium sp. BK060]MBB4170266.1 general secretion pathway protein H [Rhizobium sp. BK538]TCM76242.1 prepilin-type N-terminal cleavage/methylation domain-containing protein [Rhizobium sp. BK068]
MPQTSRSSSHSSSDGGFALLELLAALAIVAFVGAIALPYMINTGQTMGLKVQAAQIAALLRQDRNIAIAEGRTVVSTIDARRGTVLSGSSARRVILREGSAIRGERALHAGVVAFQANGLSSGGTFDIQGPRATFRISVNPLTSGIMLSTIE